MKHARIFAIAIFTFCVLSLSFANTAFALLGSFENADGYGFPFFRDVWSYDAGQTGASFTTSQYNTGRWQELFGSGGANSDSQYASQHGTSTPFAAPFALAVRSISPSTDGSYDMTVKYDLGADDLGISPTTTLQSATIAFDICPGKTWISQTGFDTVFNNVPAFSLSVGGTSISPGLTMGFSDHDPSDSSKPRVFYDDGTTYTSQTVPWTNNRFDHIQIDIDFINQTYDLLWTKDFNSLTKEFDAGNTPITIVSGASFTNSFSSLDFLYFRTHTDPSDGTVIAGLEKSYLDKFQFSVQAVPEPGSLVLAILACLGFLCKRG